jgi:hypothetical protein
LEGGSRQRLRELRELRELRSSAAQQRCGRRQHEEQRV